MSWQTIAKSASEIIPTPNPINNQKTYAEFSWETAQRELSGLPEEMGLNIAHGAIDRHALNPSLSKHLAIRWLGKNGSIGDYTYTDLRWLTNRFANVLQRLDVRKGETVFALTGRIPELYVAALGTLKNRSVFCPLVSAFGPEPIKTRMNIGKAKVLLTTPLLYERKIAGLRESLPNLKHVILVSDSPTSITGTVDYHRMIGDSSDQFAIEPTDPEDIALLHFTSGTTGTPKGTVHVHRAVVAHHLTGKFALDLHPDDVFWCTADPGWVTSTSYGILAPLTNGVTSIIDEGDFDAERWYRILQDQRVSVWYTSPAAIRGLMKAGADLARKYDLPRLRFLTSIGEPLNPEAVVWGQEAFRLPFQDNWWQTETGGIMGTENFSSFNVWFAGRE